MVTAFSVALREVTPALGAVRPAGAFRVSDGGTEARRGVLACPGSHAPELGPERKAMWVFFSEITGPWRSVLKVLERSPSLVIFTRTSKEPRHLGRREAYGGPQEGCGLVCWGAGLRLILRSGALRGEGGPGPAGQPCSAHPEVRAGRTHTALPLGREP